MIGRGHRLLRPARTLALFGAMLIAAAPPTRADTSIGVDAAIQPQAIGTPPDAAPQPMVVGQPVMFRERIATASSGQAQILFRDASKLSIGPASDLVIDQFVYDPAAGIGKLAMSTTRGVFRFVGGQVSKLDTPVTLATPSGTIGVRGGIFIADLAADGKLTVVFVYGRELTLTGRNGAATTLRRPGFAASVGGPGASPSLPFPAPRDLIASLVSQFQAPQTAPAPATVVTDARVAATALYAQLAAGNLDNALPQRLGLRTPLSGSLLNTLAGEHTFGIGTVAPLRGLRQFLQQRLN